MTVSAVSAAADPASTPPARRALGPFDGVRRRLAADAVLAASFLFLLDGWIIAVWLAGSTAMAMAQIDRSRRDHASPAPPGLVHLAPAALVVAAVFLGGPAAWLAAGFVTASLVVHALAQGEAAVRRRPFAAAPGRPASASPRSSATRHAAAAPDTSDSGRMMRTLLCDLSDLSRLEGGRLALQPRDFDLRVVLAATLRVWKAEARRKGLAFQARGLAQTPRWVEGDATRIRQVLDTLFANALKFTTSGSVSITVQAATRGDGALDVAFSVMDSGPGMTAQQIATLFEAYDPRQAGARRPGPGLPRHLAREIARLMGGDVTASSAPGLGAVLTFQAPLKPAACGERILDTSRGIRVLVVDDHAVYRQAFGLVLTSVCAEVVCANDGLQALDLLSAESFDLVLMDLSMPRLGGVAAARRLRGSSSRNRDAPILAITVSDSDDDRAACLAAGMNGFVSKPVDARELLAAVHAVLSGQEIPRAA